MASIDEVRLKRRHMRNQSLVVNVKVKIDWRIRLGLWFIKLGAWMTGMGFQMENEESIRRGDAFAEELEERLLK